MLPCSLRLIRAMKLWLLAALNMESEKARSINTIGMIILQDQQHQPSLCVCVVCVLCVCCVCACVLEREGRQIVREAEGRIWPKKKQKKIKPNRPLHTLRSLIVVTPATTIRSWWCKLLAEPIVINISTH